MSTDNTSIKQQIYNSVLKDIIQGVYEQDQLINEKGLVNQFGVSRAPVREALIELCNEGILYSIPYYGYKITPLTRHDIEEVQAYRSILECTYMQRYWHMLTPEKLDELQILLDGEYGETAEYDALTHWNKNIRFHLKLFSFYESTIAYRSLNSAMTTQTRAYAQIRWEKWHSPTFTDDGNMHRVLVDSIRENQMMQAISVLQTDITNIYM